MPEDAQPNDLRGRSAPAMGISSVRPSRSIPKSHDHRSSFKRPPDRSYNASPSKRRRVDTPSHNEIICQLPATCRKGASGCKQARKQFITLEIERLQNSDRGLKVIQHTVVDDAVCFTCIQVDILNCSLAPSSQLVNHGVEQKEQIQPKVEPRFSPPPAPTISVVAGPPRVFKSGTLSLKSVAPVTSKTFRERVVVPRTSGSSGPDLDHSIPVAELLFGKQGPPTQKPSASIAETSSASRRFSPQSQPQVATSSTQAPSLLNKTVKGQVARKAPLLEASSSTTSSTRDLIPSTSKGQIPSKAPLPESTDSFYEGSCSIHF
ncbi:hypothetical protein DFH09DRAFT_29733 [Mycena vulgaris]|nr:hypothetical protein DFH09DRAFT_29733 [Mycena vulgaris]